MDTTDDQHRHGSPGDFDLEGLLASVQQFQRDIAGSSQRLALEVADAWSKDGLVRVWVNAQGVVIQVDVDDAAFSSATSETIGAAFVEAAQAAATKMRDKVAAFQAGLRQQLSALAPSGSPALQDIEELRSAQPVVPTSAPESKERRQQAAAIAESEPKPMSPEPDEGSDGWDFTLRA
ncbi:YbaB/EbfC family nucleoid-associated protein [Mycobacterium sp. DSM 3803]|nr:YbaB/EbfC family nucleoid-associated protein [Mycobacterium sp. DSM 3803]